MHPITRIYQASSSTPSPRQKVSCLPPQDLLAACVADIQAVRDRDPACDSFIVCVLYFKGFQALQSYRVAHWMWQNGRTVGLNH